MNGDLRSPILRTSEPEDRRRSHWEEQRARFLPTYLTSLYCTVRVRGYEQHRLFGGHISLAPLPTLVCLPIVAQLLLSTVS